MMEDHNIEEKLNGDTPNYDSSHNKYDDVDSKLHGTVSENSFVFQGEYVKEAKEAFSQIKLDLKKRRDLLKLKLGYERFIIEISEKRGSYMALPRIKCDMRLDCTLGDKRYQLTPGAYCIVGTMESGKSTLLRRFGVDSNIMMCNESYGDEDVENPNVFYAQNFSNVDNIVEMEYFINDCILKKQICCIDSIRCVLSLNEMGYAKGGVPIGPFDFIDALDKYCRLYGIISILVLPVDEDAMELRERFYSMAAIRCSGAFMPFANNNALSLRIRFDGLSKSRIVRTNTFLFEDQSKLTL